MTIIEDAQFVEITEKIPDSSSEVMVLDSEIIESEEALEIPEDPNIMIIDESYFVFSNGGGNNSDNQDSNSDKNEDPDQAGDSDDNQDNSDNSNGQDDNGNFENSDLEENFLDQNPNDSDTKGDPYDFDVNHDLDNKESEFIQVLKKDRTLVS